MRFLRITFFTFLVYTSGYSQIVYEPLHSEVYKYLHRLSQKGIIEYDILRGIFFSRAVTLGKKQRRNIPDFSGKTISKDSGSSLIRAKT
jgi:hypothetical protein